MNVNSSIAAARFRSRPWKHALRGLDTVLAQQFEAYLSELVVKIKVNPTFEFVLVEDGHEK
jgi:hypothetical protein